LRSNSRQPDAFQHLDIRLLSGDRLGDVRRAAARYRAQVVAHRAGILFYASYYPPHAVLILTLTTLVYAVDALSERMSFATSRRLISAGVTVCLGVLVYYKYDRMFVETASAFGMAAAAPLGPSPVPLAISFFTFEYVHYLIERGRGTIARAKITDFFLFILFFPTLICGPIKRFASFQSQTDDAHVTADAVTEGLGRIVVGLAKKIIIADTIARAIAPIWAHPDKVGPGMLWLGIYGYAFQIYCDFAGYSDIAIGSARLLGYHVPENFNAPYLKRDIAAFWRNWHMSLTSWITDYVYIPLGGNREGRLRAHANRLVSMALCGLWHGAAWHFVLWGVYHGIGLSVHRGYHELRTRMQPGWVPATNVFARAVSVVLTFHFVCVGWVLFLFDAPTAYGLIARLVTWQ
jgi:alginate O-acetyltransferase complex protein AlgI